MKKTVKFLGIVIVVFIVLSFINHKINLSREDRLFVANGQMVEVNGHSLHVYTEGEGEVTLVFMAGGRYEFTRPGFQKPLFIFK